VTHPEARGGDSRARSELNVREGQEATKPRRVGGLLRKTSQSRCGRHPEGQPRLDVRVRARRSPRGEARRRSRYRSGGEHPGGSKTQESNVLVDGLNRRRSSGGLSRGANPGRRGGPRIRFQWRALRCAPGIGRPRHSNGKRGRASETAYGCAGGKSSGGCNPTSGSGMKQGRQARGG
jgi:hypothetical protein